VQRFGQLEHELVERDRARHARAEGLECFVGGSAASVHAAIREVGEPRPHGHVREGRDAGGNHRETEHAPLRVVGCVAEAEDDQEVDDADHHDDAAGFDRSDEHPVDPPRKRLERSE